MPHAGRQRARRHTHDRLLACIEAPLLGAYEVESVEMLKALGDRGVENAKKAQATFHAPDRIARTARRVTGLFLGISWALYDQLRYT
jgi:hypothetical protein